MNYNKWFGNTTESSVVIVTDDKQNKLTELIKENINYQYINIINIDHESLDFTLLESLDEKDLLIVSLSFDSFIMKGCNKHFSPFRKPKGVTCNFAFIRLDISVESLTQGLSTDKKSVENKLNHFYSVKENSTIHVSSESGTDITFQVNAFKSCSHYIDDQSSIAFLPPSEIYSGIVLGSANGVIVVDVSIGQMYQNGNLLDAFGLVDNDVKLLIKDSKIIDVLGNDKLKQLLNSLEPEAMTVVELGIGLSEMTPTGIIGIDESILNTCHFGIGDGTFYGIDNSSSIHLDVVINNPCIEVK